MKYKKLQSLDQEFIDSFVNDETINWMFDPILLANDLSMTF